LSCKQTKGSLVRTLGRATTLPSKNRRIMAHNCPVLINCIGLVSERVKLFPTKCIASK